MANLFSSDYNMFYCFHYGVVVSFNLILYVCNFQLNSYCCFLTLNFFIKIIQNFITFYKKKMKHLQWYISFSWVIIYSIMHFYHFILLLLTYFHPFFNFLIAFSYINSNLTFLYLFLFSVKDMLKLCFIDLVKVLDLGSTYYFISTPNPTCGHLSFLSDLP